MKIGLLILVVWVGAGAAISSSVRAGPYSPPAGEEGSTAVEWNDPGIVGWASGVAELIRGPVDITVADGALASYGEAASALGVAYQDEVYNVVTLGDGGSITLTFDKPIRNGSGSDFAVFENSFDGDYLELAFVEVSSNGVDFFRFDAVSLTQTETQVGGFDHLDSTQLYNLAGSFRAGYGTPFDLAELAGISALLDINWVTHVRVIDVIGSIDPDYASHDSLGNRINDPWKTNFDNGGFDLDGVGVLHAVPEPLFTSVVFGLVALWFAGHRGRKRGVSGHRRVV